MDIEIPKREFLNLLYSAYKAQNEEHIMIKETVLKQYGFSDRGFWEILCPSLKENGYIKDFGDPNNIPDEYYERFADYVELKNKLKEFDEMLPGSYSLAKALGYTRRDGEFYEKPGNYQFKRIDDEIEKTQKRLDEFEEWARNSYPFFVVNVEKLKEAVEARTKEERTNVPQKSKKQKKIEILEVVRPKNETNKFVVVVNKDYLNPILGDKAKPSWDMLFRVAGEEDLEGRTYKSSLEYFNTNKNCKLYTQTGYSLTKIFKTEYYIKPTISIKMIGNKAYTQRVKTQKDRKAT